MEEAGDAAADNPRLLAAFDALCEQLRQRLQPLFGTAAVNGLFARAFHLATLEFSWLPKVNGKNSDGSAGTIAFEAVKMDQAEAGLSAALAHSIELLCTFVGEDLVLPIVHDRRGRRRCWTRTSPTT